jgi:SOS response regulatory protein OraA/RecX
VTAPTVTALRERRDGRVAVALDGEDWRVLPAEAVVRAGLHAGLSLDRERARTLARELRRAKALSAAGKALRDRDLSTRRLAERLTRRGISRTARDEALETLTRTGLVDDERAARARALALAERNLGDAAIRHDLEVQGIGPELIELVCADLPPERDRAARVVSRRGRSASTARYLARRGFDEDAVELGAPDTFAADAPAELG